MQQPSYISKDRLRELENELMTLKTKTVKEIAEAIDVAKQNGDLSENAEYQEAKERMAFVQGRIAELAHILTNAVIFNNKPPSDIIGIGSTIVVETAGGQKTFTIVGSQEADPASGKISNESPLGEAFIGKSVGDSVDVVTPVKKTVYIIKNIS